MEHEKQVRAKMGMGTRCGPSLVLCVMYCVCFAMCCICTCGCGGDVYVTYCGGNSDWMEDEETNTEDTDWDVEAVEDEDQL